jgi:hypothetical protein
MNLKDEKIIQSFNLGIEKEEATWKTLCVNGKIILKWFLKNYYAMEWTLVNRVIGFQVQ